MFIFYIAHMILMVPLFDTHESYRWTETEYHGYDLSRQMKKINDRCAIIWEHHKNPLD
jgi:hypothetical protein